ncbi:probable oligoribonuclease isoform X1 [Choristoneura fumiferana]
MYSLRNFLTLHVNNIVKSIIRPMSSKNQLKQNMTPLAREAAKRIVWVDLEMTGLNIENDHIMEIGCLITDADLNVVATGPNLIIHQPDSILDKMGTWCMAQHGESGLTEASRKSKLSVQDAERQILEFVSIHVPEKRCPLGGNSVYVDRLFLNKYMPRFNNYLHYRIIDVSTIKELARRWYQKDYSGIPQKKFRHRSIDDILESVEELKYYKKHIFKSLE